MIDTLGKFQCPDCKCALTTAAASCLACGRAYAGANGILDFVGGRVTTQLDTSGYDASHGIDDDSGTAAAPARPAERSSDDGDNTR